MSKFARRFLATALVYLALGLVLNAIGMFDIWLGFNPLSYTSVGSTTQALLIGCFTQGFMAAVYTWLVESPRLAALAWASFNLGLAFTVVGQPVVALTGNGLVGGLVALGGLLQLTGGALFGYEVAQAIRAVRKKPLT